MSLPSRSLSRRQVLQFGTLPLLGLSLPDVLAAKDRQSQSEKSCIFIYQYGGLSQLDSWDPKPDGPSEIRGPYKTIATSTPGFRVGELMPQLARRSHRYAVIRSMSHRTSVHNLANQMLLAGEAQPARNAPSLGAIVSKLRPSTGGMPSHVWLQKFGGGAMPPEASYLTGGLLGMAHAPMLIGSGHADNPANPNFKVDALELAQGLSRARIRERLQILENLEAQSKSPLSDRGTSQFRAQATDLLSGSKARQAFDLKQETDRVRDRYGRHPMGQNLLLARRLIEAGTRLVNVVAWCGLAPKDKFVSVETWDMHGNAGIDIFGNGWNGLGWALPCCDQSVSALLDDLHDRGLLESTLVVLVGEFGRTPRISKGSKAIGRDHWPNCYSAMLAGAGIQGGAVYGSSDAQAAYVKDNPVSPEDFAATIFHALDIDPRTPISPDGGSRKASRGFPVTPLF